MEAGEDVNGESCNGFVAPRGEMIRTSIQMSGRRSAVPYTKNGTEDGPRQKYAGTSSHARSLFFQAGGQGCPLGGKIENLKIKKVPAAGSHNR